MTVRILILSTLVACCVTPATFAHEGKAHVMGTVTTLDAPRVVVTDAAGKPVAITITPATTYLQGDAPATASALAVGARVVVDVAGGPGTLTATQIRMAPASVTPATADHGGGHDQPHEH